jgi:hypothetical protein
MEREKTDHVWTFHLSFFFIWYSIGFARRYEEALVL